MANELINKTKLSLCHIPGMVNEHGGHLINQLCLLTRIGKQQLEIK